jgi:hypothetical protein
VIRLAVAYDRQRKAEKEQAKAGQTAKDNECFEAAKGDPAKNPFDCFDPHPELASKSNGHLQRSQLPYHADTGARE